MPAFVSYGDNNRTQMIRTAGPGHFEDRTVSAACNPYLALAVHLTAGLEGMKQKTMPGQPNLGNMYERTLAEIQESGVKLLPQSLSEALDELKQDAVVRGGMGPIAEEFLALKAKEWESYDRQVTPFEVEQYLTMI